MLVVEFVRPRESAAVTVTDLLPVPLNMAEVTFEPVAANAPEIVYEDIDAPLPAVADDCTLILVYPLTYIPLLFIHALELTGDNVTVGAVGFIAEPTYTVALYVLDPISVPPEYVLMTMETVPLVALGSFA